VNHFLKANHLVTAWALEARSGKDQGRRFLGAWLTRYPSDPVIRWCERMFNGAPAGSVGHTPDDETIRILQRVIRMNDSVLKLK
jgi:hypothetical protein